MNKDGLKEADFLLLADFTENPFDFYLEFGAYCTGHVNELNQYAYVAEKCEVMSGKNPIVKSIKDDHGILTPYSLYESNYCYNDGVGNINFIEPISETFNEGFDEIYSKYKEKYTSFLSHFKKYFNHPAIQVKVLDLWGKKAMFLPVEYSVCFYLNSLEQRYLKDIIVRAKTMQKYGGMIKAFRVLEVIEDKKGYVYPRFLYSIEGKAVVN